jgi:hypothetical protein
MKKHTDEKLQENYNKFIAIIEKYFKGERLERLLHMYSMEELGPNLMLAPASGNISYHNAYEGGYIDHIFNVCKNSLRMMKTFQEAGANIDFTEDELLFSALHHDLGKLGEKGKPNYVPNPSDWHVKNQGKVYVSNPELNFMTHTDRTFYLLNIYGVKYSEKEFFGIKLTDGMYDEDNEKYLKSYNPEIAKRILRTPMYHILHFADSMSSQIERQNFEN